MKRIILGVFIITVFLACNKKIAKVSDSSVPVGDTSQNSLDWEGTYFGLLPCAECELLKSKLTLTGEQYVLESMRMNSGVEGIMTMQTGNFEWNSDGNIITLYSENEQDMFSLKVGENRILGVTELSKDKSLVKFDEKITGKKWQLQSLNGQTIIVGKPIYMDIDKDNGISGFSGCNSMRGGVAVDGKNVTFSPMMSTKMSCRNIKVESAFITALSDTQTHEIKDEQLLLFDKNEKQIAAFNWVFF